MREADFLDPSAVLAEVSVELGKRADEMHIANLSPKGFDTVAWQVATVKNRERVPALGIQFDTWLVFPSREVLRFFAHTLTRFNFNAERRTNFFEDLNGAFAFNTKVFRQNFFEAIGQERLATLLYSSLFASSPGLKPAWLVRSLEHLVDIKRALGWRWSDFALWALEGRILSGFSTPSVLIPESLVERLSTLTLDHLGPESLLSLDHSRHSRETPSGFLYFQSFMFKPRMWSDMGTIARAAINPFA
jgi:hypothetical protein